MRPNSLLTSSWERMGADLAQPYQQLTDAADRLDYLNNWQDLQTWMMIQTQIATLYGADQSVLNLRFGLESLAFKVVSP